MLTKERAMVRISLAVIVGVTASCGGDSPAGPVPVSRPAFTITSPARADMLQAGTQGPADVTIAGQVCDRLYPIVSLTLNGTAVPVSGSPLCVPFSVTRESRWGLTILDGEARNSQGTVTRLAQSFLRGPDYFPAAFDTAAPARVPQGLFAHLGQSVIDDGNRATVDDIATVVQLLLNTVDFNAAVPNPILNSVATTSYDCLLYTAVNRYGYRVTHGVLNPGAIGIQVAVLPDPSGGLRTTIRLTGVSMPVAVTGWGDLQCLGEVSATAVGTLTATTITFSWTAQPEFEPAGLAYQGSDHSVQFENLALNVDFSGLSFIDNMIGDIVSGTLSAFNAGLLNLLLNVLSPQVNDLLAGFVPEPTVTVPLPGVSVAAQPDTFAFPPGVMRVGAAVQAWPTDVRSGPAPTRGALRRGGAAPVFAGPAFELGTAVKDDVVNQFLWAAWQAGEFDLASVGALGCDTAQSGLAFATFAELPPVLMPGATGDSVALGLGDLRLTGTVARSAIGGTGPDLEVVLYASGIMAGTLGVGASHTLTATFSPTATLAVEIAAIDDSSAVDAVREAVAPFFACVARRLSAAALDAVALAELRVGWRPGNVAAGREGNYTTERGTVP